MTLAACDPPPVDPMLAKLTRELPPAGAGARTNRSGTASAASSSATATTSTSRAGTASRLLRYFPELREPLLEQLPERVVVDGELVVANERGLDFDALQLRQHPAVSRVNKLAAEIPASFVAFDLLALGDESLCEPPFRERRARLE